MVGLIDVNFKLYTIVNYYSRYLCKSIQKLLIHDTVFISMIDVQDTSIASLYRQISITDTLYYVPFNINS